MFIGPLLDGKKRVKHIRHCFVKVRKVYILNPFPTINNPPSNDSWMRLMLELLL